MNFSLLAERKKGSLFSVLTPVFRRGEVRIAILLIVQDERKNEKLKKGEKNGEREEHLEASLTEDAEEVFIVCVRVENQSAVKAKRQGKAKDDL